MDKEEIELYLRSKKSEIIRRNFNLNQINKITESENIHNFIQ